MHTLTFSVLRNYGHSWSGIEVPVTLRVDHHRSVDLLAKVDTGAEFCIFQREYADMLELPFEAGEHKRFATATGAFDTRGHSVTLSSFDFEFESVVFFATEVNFPRNVLGRQGWLDRLRVGLVHHDQRLYLSKYDD